MKCTEHVACGFPGAAYCVQQLWHALRARSNVPHSLRIPIFLFLLYPPPSMRLTTFKSSEKFTWLLFLLLAQHLWLVDVCHMDGRTETDGKCWLQTPNMSHKQATDVWCLSLVSLEVYVPVGVKEPVQYACCI